MFATKRLLELCGNEYDLNFMNFKTDSFKIHKIQIIFRKF